MEFDEFDFSKQPFAFHALRGYRRGCRKQLRRRHPQRGPEDPGSEYLARVTTHAPDGTVSVGAAQVEMFINGAYHRYGFK